MQLGFERETESSCYFVPLRARLNYLSEGQYARRDSAKKTFFPLYIYVHVSFMNTLDITLRIIGSRMSAMCALCIVYVKCESFLHSCVYIYTCIIFIKRESTETLNISRMSYSCVDARARAPELFLTYNGR